MLDPYLISSWMHIWICKKKKVCHFGSYFHATVLIIAMCVPSRIGVTFQNDSLITESIYKNKAPQRTKIVKFLEILSSLKNKSAEIITPRIIEITTVKIVRHTLEMIHNSDDSSVSIGFSSSISSGISSVFM